MCPVALATLGYDPPEAAGGKHPGAPPRLNHSCNKTINFKIWKGGLQYLGQVHDTGWKQREKAKEQDLNGQGTGQTSESTLLY